MFIRLIKERQVLATLSGNIMEFYDFIIYAFLSTYIAKQFFNTEDQLVATIMSFGVFASGYLSRPLGALVFGHIGDKYGRKHALVYSIACISISTLLIGLLPTYDQVGALAPILLIILRLIQGFSVSGEEGGAAVYLAETYDTGKKGMLGSLILGSAYMGVLLGSFTCLILTSFMTEENITAFGWRIPFILSVILGVVSFKLRIGAAESKEFTASKKLQNFSPVKQILTNQLPLVIVLIFLVASLSIPIYMYTIFLPSYLTIACGQSATSSLQISTISLTFLSIGVPIFGNIADRIGYIKQFKLGCILLIVLAAPVFYSFASGSIYYTFIGITLMGLAIFLVAGPLFAILVDAFATNIRFTGVSLVFNSSMTIFGSTVPALGFMLIKHYQSNLVPQLGMIIAGVFGLISLYLLNRYQSSNSRALNVAYS